MFGSLSSELPGEEIISEEEIVPEDEIPPEDDVIAEEEEEEEELPEEDTGKKEEEKEADPSLLVNVLEDINENSNSRKIKFKFSDPKSATSHCQGYARYRGVGYDFHLFPYSNVAGRYGYLLVESDATKSDGTAKHQFTLQVPKTEITYKQVSNNKDARHDPHFNHPCGFQIFEDYLLVPVIPYQNTVASFYDAAVIYVYDLSPLKEPTPKAPVLVNEDPIKIPKVNGASLSCIGVTQMQMPGGRYVMGLMTDNNLDIYFSSEYTHGLGSVKWESKPTYVYSLKTGDGKNKYQGMGFVFDDQKDLFVIGFDTRGGAYQNDYADLYRLTDKDVWASDSELEPIAKKHLICKDGARFLYGGGLEVLGENKFRIYSTEEYHTSGGITINWFD